MTPTTAPHSPLRLLTALPDLVGGPPRESLLLVPVRDGAASGALRIDLPRPDHVDAVAQAAVGTLCRVPDLARAIAIVVTDAPFADGSGVVHEALMSAVTERAAACGIDVIDELCVAGDAWGRYADAVPRPRDEVPALGDETPAPADPALRAAVRDAFDATLRTARAIDRLDADADSGVPMASGSSDIDPHAAVRIDAACESPTFLFEAALGWDPDDLDPYDVAILLFIVRGPAMRDVALTQWSTDAAGGERALDWQNRWDAGENPPPEGALRLAGEGPRPDVDRVRRARALASAVARVAPDELTALAHTVAGWLAWALGSASAAAADIATARRADPSYGLAQLMTQLLDAGILPGWVFDPRGMTLREQRGR